MSKEKFELVGKEVLDIIEKIKNLYHKNLEKAIIVALFDTRKIKSKNKYITIGKLRKVSDEDNTAGVYGDFILTIKEEWWNSATDKQKEALIDHELSHGASKLTNKGLQFYTKKHDVTEFIHVVGRYGAWSKELEDMKNVLSKS